MSDLSIRPWTEADADPVAAIYAHYVVHSTATFDLEIPATAALAEKFSRMTGAGFPVLVGELAGRVIGYAYAGPYRERPAYRFTCENAIYLDPEMTGRGFGGPLLDATVDRARTAGLNQMLAVITAESAASVRLHARRGFAEVGRYHAVGFKFDRWLDVVHMQLALN